MSKDVSLEEAFRREGEKSTRKKVNKRMQEKEKNTNR